MALVAPCAILAYITTVCPPPCHVYKSHCRDTVDEISSMQMAVEARARQIVADMGGHLLGSSDMFWCLAPNERHPSPEVTPAKKAVLCQSTAGCSRAPV